MKEIRDKIITIRCTEKEREIIRRNASIGGEEVSDYIRNHIFDSNGNRTPHKKQKIRSIVEIQEEINTIMRSCTSSGFEKGEIERKVIEELKKGCLVLWEF